ncbi:MAG: PIN domain-containing protein [Methanobrevibacter sp.]|jgi:hypothetical protein|nr:PIN domain-containing protein [Candidatus Methanoflexus mossambicus]
MDYENCERIAIILDTNILHKSRKSINNVSKLPLKRYDDAIFMLEINDMIEYVNIYIPEIVLLELSSQKITMLENQLEDLKKLSKEFNNIHEVNIEGHDEFNIKEHIEFIKDEVFRDVNCIKIPKNRDDMFNYILKMSLDKIPPFNINKDSDPGFKDSILFLSIISFAKSEEFEKYVLFSKDKIFKTNEKIMTKIFKEKTGKKLEIEETEDVQGYIANKFGLLADFWKYFHNNFYPFMVNEMNEFKHVKINNDGIIFNQINDKECEITLAFSQEFEDNIEIDDVSMTIIFKKENEKWTNDFDIDYFKEEIIY